jgi:hypothetical protein
MKIKIEKLKSWIQAHPWSAVGIIAGVIVLIYYLYSKYASSSSSTSSTTTDSGTVGNATTTTGSGGSGSSSSDTASILSAVTSSISSLSDSFTAAMTANQKSTADSLTAMQTANQTQYKTLADNMAAALASVKSTVATPASYYSTAPGVSNSANTFVAANDASTNANSGKPIMLSTPSGGSISVSDLAAVTMPAANAKVTAVTGGSGTIESQLSGKSGAEKLAILQNAGLAK